MESMKTRLVRRILLNRWAMPATQRLHRYLTRQLTPGVTPKKMRSARWTIKGLEQRTARLRKELEQQKTLMDARLRKTKQLQLATEKKLLKAGKALNAAVEKEEQLRGRVQDAQARIRAMHAAAKKRRETDQDVPLEGEFLNELRKGATLEAAFVKVAQKTGTAYDRAVGRSTAFRLYDQPSTRPLGALMLGIFMHREEFHETAFGYFQEADQEVALTYAARDYFGASLGMDRYEGHKALLRFLDNHGASLKTAEAYGLVELLIKFRYYDEARQAVQTVPSLRNPDPETNSKILQKVDWLWEMLDDSRQIPAPTSENQINLAIMDYKLWDRDRTSANRGDYVQTLAALAHICRFQNVDFTGGTPLSALLNVLKDDINDDHQLKEPAATVVPVPLDRDFASSRKFHPQTWLICNGWFMHSHFRGGFDFPFPPEIKPIFISFHLNNPNALTPETAAYLQEHEPIGCRDWTTVYRLRDYGIACFFSGCLTSTIGQIMPGASVANEDVLAAVETTVSDQDYENWDVRESSQIGDFVRDLSLTEGIKDAKSMLSGYLDAKRIQTSRLHCYLPCRSIGLDVDYRPKNSADIRLEGLFGITDSAFDAMREGITDKLGRVLEEIFAGATSESVMDVWREICAPDVAAANAYCDAPFSTPPVSDIQTTLGTVKHQASTQAQSGGFDLAFALDNNVSKFLPVVLQSIADTTSATANVHLFHRDIDPNYLSQLATAFPEFHFDFYDFSAVNYGNRLQLLSHTTEATLDRLYLPELLIGVSKVVYLDTDVLVRSDLSELYDTDVNDHVIAAKFTQMVSARNAVKLISRLTTRLPRDIAYETRRRFHKKMQAPANVFNSGVMVMNLEQMRAEAFTENHIYLATDCLCNDQDILNIYAAGRVKEIPQAWNYVPAQDYESDPNLVHWAGPLKPWAKDGYCLWQSEFDSTFSAAWDRMDSTISPRKH